MSIDEALHRIRTGLKALGFMVEGPDEFYSEFSVQGSKVRITFKVDAPLASIIVRGGDLKPHLRLYVAAGIPKETTLTHELAAPGAVPDDIESLKEDSAALRRFVALARQMLADEFYSGDHPIELVRDLAAHVPTHDPHG